MTSRTCALPILLALACGGGNSGDTGSSGPGSSGPGSSSGASTDASGSEGSGTASGPTTGGITGGSTEGTSTSTGPGTSGDPGSSSSSSSSSGSSSSGDASSTGDPADACVDVSGDYGPCDAIIGYGFDGTTCRAFSGCNCAPHCDDFWPDELSCALGCAAAGGCNPAAMHPAGINKDPVQPGSFCDELDACASDPGSAEWLTKIFGKVECEPASYPCEQGQTCHLLWQGTLDEAQWSQACAASLLPGADLQCVIWGP